MADSRPLQKLLAHWCNGFVSPCDNSATLGKPSGSPRCGAYIIDTRKGDIVHWIRFEGAVRELFDASFIPGIRAPMCVGLGNPEMRTLITFDGEASASTVETVA